MTPRQVYLKAFYAERYKMLQAHRLCVKCKKPAERYTCCDACLKVAAERSARYRREFKAWRELQKLSPDTPKVLNNESRKGAFATDSENASTD